MERKKITVVGSYNVGLFLKGENIPKVGETLIGNSFTEGGGGKGSNQALAAGKLGADAVFVGCIGNDSYGKYALSLYKSIGVSSEYIRVNDSIHSGISVIFIDSKGNNSIMVVPGANYSLSKEDIDNAFSVMNESAIVGFQLENELDIVAYGIKRANESGATVLLDPAPAQKLPDELYKYIHIIKPNEHEAYSLSGIKVTDEKSAEEAGKWFISKGVRTAIITLGDKGAVLVEKERTAYFPSVEADAVDTTGAGDCFSGAFMTALSEGKTIDEAIRFAHVAASISVRSLGVVEALPTRAQVEELL
ncbi:MAG: ribokinase [Ruminococcaceae bacterium]|nr:ribokinase [Oscillospiraceae bacterium]